jgi:hypothetical protein
VIARGAAYHETGGVLTCVSRRSDLGGPIQTVDGVDPRRTKVAIGTDYTVAHTIGRKPATLAEVRACIAQLRPLLAGATVTSDGTLGR